MFLLSLKNMKVLIYHFVLGSFFQLCFVASFGANGAKEILPQQITDITKGFKEEIQPTPIPTPNITTTASPNITTTASPNTTTTASPNTTTTSTTAQPNTTTTSTTSTTTPATTTSTTPTPTTIPPTTKPTAAPTSKPEPDHKFDGPSFVGGMILTMGLMAIAFVSWKFYKARTERNYHTL